MSEKREFRSMAEPVSLGEEMRATGYATTFDVPYVLWEEEDGRKWYERIDHKALDGADMTDVVLRYDHKGKVLARVKGGTLILTPDAHGLRMDADLSKSQAARDLHEEIKNGLVTKMSWAFTVAEEAWDRETRTRTVLRIKKVYDVSAVSFPADEDTEISARSAADGEICRERAERRARQRIKIKCMLGGNRNDID